MGIEQISQVWLIKTQFNKCLVRKGTHCNFLCRECIGTSIIHRVLTMISYFHTRIVRDRGLSIVDTISNLKWKRVSCLLHALVSLFTGRLKSLH